MHDCSTNQMDYIHCWVQWEKWWRTYLALLSRSVSIRGRGAVLCCAVSAASIHSCRCVVFGRCHHFTVDAIRDVIMGMGSWRYNYSSVNGILRLCGNCGSAQINSDAVPRLSLTHGSTGGTVLLSQESLAVVYAGIQTNAMSSRQVIIFYFAKYWIGKAFS